MGNRNRSLHNECERGLFRKRTWHFLLVESAHQTHAAPRQTPSSQHPSLAFCVGSDPYRSLPLKEVVSINYFNGSCTPGGVVVLSDGSMRPNICPPTVPCCHVPA